MRRRGEELLRGSDFAQPAKIHHGDPVAHRFHHSEIMGDEQQRQSKARLHVFQQIEDLSANRNVERRNRLVADDELGIEDECARNADALALSAGKFMRQAPDHQRRIESNRGEYLADELLPLFRILDARYHQRLGDDLADAPPRIQRSDRILENKLHAPAHPPQCIALHRGEVLTIEQNPPGDSPTQLQHRAAQSRLAAAGLPDQTKRLAARYLQAYAGHRVYGLAAQCIFNDQVIHLEKRIVRTGLLDFLHHAQTPAVT